MRRRYSGPRARDPDDPRVLHPAPVGQTRPVTHRQRWDADVRGTGVGDASGAAPGIRELLELAHRPQWVSEDAEAHLEGHLRRAADGLGLEVTATRTSDGGLFEVTLLHPPAMSRRAVRVAA